MTREILLDTIGGVDESYIADAQKLRDGIVTSGHRRTPRKTVFLIAAVLVSMLALGGTVWASTSEGFFQDIFNWKRSIIGTSYENSTDEIIINATNAGTSLVISIQFVDPQREPYSLMDTIRIKSFDILDASGRTVFKNQKSDPEQIAAGTVEIMLSDLGLSPGNYSIVISELEAEKKAEQPLGIHGTWSCNFTIK